MNLFNTRRNIIIVLSFSLFVIGYFVWYVYRNMKTAVYETKAVKSALQSLRSLEDIMDDMQELETAKRGFLLSGNERFLVPFHIAIKKLGKDTLVFKSLYSIYPQRKGRYEEILELMRPEVKKSESIIRQSFVNKNITSLIESFRSDYKGKDFMEEFSNKVLSLENEDRALLQHSNIDREKAASNTVKLFGLLSLIFLLFAFLLFWQIFRSLRKTEIYENDISFLANLVEQNDDAIISADFNFNILSWNKGAEKMYGYSKSEAIGKKCHLLLQSSSTEEDRQLILEKFLLNESYLGEFEYRKKDGTLITVLASFSSIKNNNNIAACAIVHRDITEKKIAEHLLKEFNKELNLQVQEKTSELKKLLERFNIVAKATNDILWDVDLSSGNLWWNDNFYIKFGYQRLPETNNSLIWEDLIHPDDIERVNTHTNHILYNTNESHWSNEYRFLKSDGTYVHIYDRSYIIRDKQGVPLRMIGSMADITELSHLRKSEEKYTMMVSQASDGILVLSKSGQYIDANPAAVNMIGYTKSELLKLSNRDILSEGQESIINEFSNELNEGKIIFQERFLKRKDGTLIATEAGYKMLSTGEYIAVVRDITERKSTERKLRKSIETRELIMKSALDGIITIGMDERIISWNPQAEGIFGWKESEVLGKLLSEIVIPEWARDKHKAGHASYLQTGKSIVLDRINEFTGLHANGSEISLELLIRKIKSEGGDFICIFVRDITARKDAEIALRLNEEKYRTLVEQAPDAIALFDAMGDVIEVNTSSTQLTGYSKDELSKMNLRDILLEEELNENPVQYNVLRTGIPTFRVRKMRKKDGTIIITEVRTQILPDGRFLSVVRDITERKKGEEELELSYKSIRNLTEHLQNIREEERINIARELHDELGQLLSALKMDISWLCRKVDTADINVNNKVEDILSVLNETVESVRRITSQLRPGLLDDIGLSAAIDWQLRDFGIRYGLKVYFNSTYHDELKLSDKIKTSLFRIFQESLTNVAKHSEAENLTVSLDEINEKIILSISDDGIGFSLEGEASKKTFGLLGMKERAEMIGGEYEIISAPGEGTSLIISVPLG